MNDDRNDLSMLSPRSDPLRWERVVASIRAAADPELARRNALRSPAVILQYWARTTALVAAAVASISISILATRTEPGPEIRPDEPIRGVAEAIGLQEPFARWVEAGHAPTVDELLVIPFEVTR